MEDGHAIYGVAADGYWCDVGSKESYMQVHRDILDGKVKLFVPGIHAREGLWVAESARIDETASLGDHVVIGENVRVRSGAVIGDYTVVDDNCVIGADARVTHSILWSDTFVGKQATVSGAVLCRHVDVRTRAGIEVGAVIGDESVVGAGAHIGTDVQIYPYKRIESAATVNTSVIWESTGSQGALRRRGRTRSRRRRHHSRARSQGRGGVRHACFPRVGTSSSAETPRVLLGCSSVR